ncbi:TonB family protein [Undibacterium pigrum]|uniref:TonB family protein n=1 Tax=Undibacterium pigrum TaxID=401470 RepID=A0A318JC25_9BURK|nr:TonB family protein [Undibacterium pigrum]PXX45146.1 TonB family protein [Undibacterium pigrum]
MKNTILATLMSFCITGVAQAAEIDTIRALNSEALTAFVQKQQYPLAFDLNKQALLLAEKEQDTYPERVIEVLNQQANFYENLKQLKQAEAVLLRVIAIQEKVPALAGRERARTLNRLGNMHFSGNDYKSAEISLLQAIKILQSAYGEEDTGLIGNFALLGDIFLAQGRLEEAETTLKRAVTLNEKQSNDKVYWEQSILRTLEKIYRLTGRDDLAKETAAKFANIKPSAFITNVKPDGKFKNANLRQDSCKKPEYPREALMYELQGRVQFRFLITETGSIAAKYISQSSGWKVLDDAAFNALSLCKFDPASLNDKSVTSWLGYQYVWSLGVEGPAAPTPELIESSCRSDKYSVVNPGAKQWLVRLRFLVDAQGKTSGIKIEDSSKDSTVDNDVVKLLERCQFAPASMNGKPYQSAGVIRFVRTVDKK